MRNNCALLVLFLVVYEGIHAQVRVSGPACVVPGTVYQYIVSGKWDSAATMQVQLTGGRLADTSIGKVSLFSGRFSPQILVVWNDSASSTRSLSLTSSVGNTSLTVNYTGRLNPGVIDSSCTTQRVGLDSLPALPITCSEASGGTCSPFYRYQWQQSPDRMHWKDVLAATGKDLILRSPVRRSLYYRRKVTETSTGSIGYSKEVAVFLHLSAGLPDSVTKAIMDSAATISVITSPTGKEQPLFVGMPMNVARLFFTKPKEEPFHG